MGLGLLQGEFRDKIIDEYKARDKQRPSVDSASEGGSSFTDSVKYWLDLSGDILENTENAVSVLNDLRK